MNKTAFFNKFLHHDPQYVNVKDYGNILKTIIILKPTHQHIKVKFAKYKLMDNPEFFYKAQRLYAVLYKFVCKVKARKYIKQYNNDGLDLCGAPLQNPITLVEGKTAYQFSTKDLQKVVVNALTHHKHLIPEPLEAKNPYTNVPFSKHNLMQIYAFTNKKHPLFTSYYKCNFDIFAFHNQNRRLLLEYAIDGLDFNWTEDMIDDIYYICDNNNIKVHSDFPPDVLYRVFKPYLKLLYKVRYMFHPGKQLSFWLDCFELYNPYFGMKYIDNRGHIGFDDRHLEFDFISSTFTGCDDKVFRQIVENKYKTGLLSISLQPLSGVTYFEPEENVEYNDASDEESV
jgi:hypothetical protein